MKKITQIIWIVIFHFYLQTQAKMTFDLIHPTYNVIENKNKASQNSNKRVNHHNMRHFKHYLLNTSNKNLKTD